MQAACTNNGCPIASVSSALASPPTEGGGQGADQVIVVKDGMLEGGNDRRAPDGGAAGK
jgi:hypothetical protein